MIYLPNCESTSLKLWFPYLFRKDLMMYQCSFKSNQVVDYTYIIHVVATVKTTVKVQPIYWDFNLEFHFILIVKQELLYIPIERAFMSIWYGLAAIVSSVSVDFMCSWALIIYKYITFSVGISILQCTYINPVVIDSLIFNKAESKDIRWFWNFKKKNN